MDARRVRFLAGSTILSGLLAGSLAAPAAAADCALSAPAYVNVGTQITIEGAGFPASASVDISLEIQGGASDEFTVQSDGTGALQFAFTPEVIDIGVTTVKATSGSACNAVVTYTVLAAGATPPPVTPEPEVSSGTGAEPGAPPTDVDPLATIGGAPAVVSWGLAFALVATGCLGLFLTRPARRR